MQPIPFHSVEREYFEVEFAGSEADALALQGRLSLCAQSLLPVIEQALDRHSPAQGVLRIERLDVDAGCIPLARLEQELPALFRRCLDGALRAHLAGGAGAQGGQAAVLHASVEQALDEALAYFLQYGTLPAGLHLAPGMDFESAVLAAWRGAGSPLASGEPMRTGAPPRPAALLTALRSAPALRRLDGQFSPAFQHALLARLAPALAAVLEASVLHLRANARGAPVAAAERLLYRAALELAVRGGAADAGMPVHDALWRALPEQAARAARAALLPPARGNPGRADPGDTGPTVKGAPAAPAAPTAKGGASAPATPPVSLPEASQNASHPDQEQGIYIYNAGLVLLHPFLPRLFEALGVSSDARLLQPGRALALLHFLASGQPEAPEYALALPKLLCQLPLTANVEAGIVLAAGERDEAQALLAAVVKHWTALRDTSPDGLRGAFLLRSGKLSQRAGEWLLQVETEGADILLGELPWGISAIQLPWMERILWVEWAWP